MELQSVTREEALARLKAAKEKKKKTTERIVERMVREYEKRTGKKANYIEVW